MRVQAELVLTFGGSANLMMFVAGVECELKSEFAGECRCESRCC